MEATWRWFGPTDPITLSDIRQAGATGVVTALHDVANGRAWPLEAIRERRRAIEAAGLSWSVVESVPVTEAIKQGHADRDRDIAAFCTTLSRLAAAGIDTVCYNFMPVLDWTRTELARACADGGTALAFDQCAYAAFDLYILARSGAAAEHGPAERAAARRFFDALDAAGRARLTETVIAGLPGAEARYDLDGFRAMLAAYRDIDAAGLRARLRYFLEAVVPVAERLGVRLAIHPDDPPQSLFGLPRVVSSAADARWLTGVVDSPVNGLTLCTGSYGVAPGNDLVAMAREFGPWIHFAHLRATRRDAAEPRSFQETDPLAGDVDMVGVVTALLAEEDRRAGTGAPRLPIRPDHGRCVLGDAHRPTRPGYPLYGRMKALAELRGVERALRGAGRA